jgi:carboxyl-terminal processing protease
LTGVKPVFGDKQAYATLTNAEALIMLDQIEKDIKENYYDPSLHGVDLDKRFKEVRAKITVAKTQDDALLQIAAAVGVLNDSHTGFVPPVRPYSVDYGFRMQAVGDSDCYVTQVRQGSDAEAKGLKRGDRIVSINGLSLVRQDIHNVEYGYRVFPQSGFHLNVRSPEGPEQALTVLAKVTPGQKMISKSDFLEWIAVPRTKEDWDRMFGQGNQSQFFEVEKKVLFWKLPSFFVYPKDLEDQAHKARSFQNVVLDLRGNLGGRVDALDAFLGAFFERDITVGVDRGRKGSKPIVIKGRGKSAIGGKLIVLIDSNSSSAAEIFSRVIQLEKKGTILGDRSSGRVMKSERFVHAVSLNPRFVTQYSSEITVGDLIMNDGKSLEGVGVMPDERVLPTPADLAVGRDPVLARAAALAGVEMTPEKAGSIFTFKWPEKPIEID